MSGISAIIFILGMFNIIPLSLMVACVRRLLTFQPSILPILAGFSVLLVFLSNTLLLVICKTLPSEKQAALVGSNVFYGFVRDYWDDNILVGWTLFTSFACSVFNAISALFGISKRSVNAK